MAHRITLNVAKLGNLFHGIGVIGHTEDLHRHATSRISGTKTVTKIISVMAEGRDHILICILILTITATIGMKETIHRSSFLLVLFSVFGL